MARAIGKLVRPSWRKAEIALMYIAIFTGDLTADKSFHSEANVFSQPAIWPPECSCELVSSTKPVTGPLPP